MVDWDSILCWILSCFKGADLLVMCELMGKFPSKNDGGVDSKASRSKIYNATYIQHFRETGLDMDTQQRPKGDNLTWVLEEVRKADALAIAN